MAFGALVSMPLAGWLGARLGSARVCQVAGLLYCAWLPLLPLMGSPVSLAAMLFVFGIAHGALDVAMNAQAVSVETHYPRPIMSMFHALFSFGGLVGSSAGGWIAGSHIIPAKHFAAVGAIIGAITAI
jgi:predicted MFS family arabinose efflux permease